MSKFKILQNFFEVGEVVVPPLPLEPLSWGGVAFLFLPWVVLLSPSPLLMVLLFPSPLC